MCNELLLISRDELVDIDDGVETVCKIVEEIMHKASCIIFEHYIEREIYPHAVQDAKIAILKRIAVS